MVTKRKELLPRLASSALLLVLAFPCFHQQRAIAAPPALVQGIDTKAFCARLGMPVPVPGAILVMHRIRYQMPDLRATLPHPASFTVAVFPTVDQAVAAFKSSQFEEGSYTLDSPHQAAVAENTPGVGDEYLALIFQRSPGTPKASPARPHGHCRLRRANVMLDFDWRGDLPSAIAFCRRADALLRSGSAICPHGSAVPVPQVAFSRPRPGGSDKVQYRVNDGTAIVPEQTPIERAADSGTVHVWTTGLKSIDFATTRNVIFAAPYPSPESASGRSRSGQAVEPSP